MLRQPAVAQLVFRIHPYFLLYDIVVYGRKSNYTTLSSIVLFCLHYFFKNAPLLSKIPCAFRLLSIF
jgi:hypothetical protein